ncbi:hypothetical protein [Nocardioides convexus]|nr:hypothetical protein [Nocardioides convexus]
MVFAHDTAVSLRAAVTLVNSALEPVGMTSPEEPRRVPRRVRLHRAPRR